MPDTGEAYITELSLTRSSASMSRNYDIKITVRVSQADVGTDFIERLNSSAMFQEAKQVGTRSREESDTLYPISFSVTCNLRQPGSL